MTARRNNLAIAANVLSHAHRRGFSGFLWASLVSATVMGTLTGCGQETSFNGKVGQRYPAQDAMALRSTCADSALQISQTELAKSGGNIALSGEFCAQNTSDLQLLFALDFSESMKSNDPAVGSFGSGVGVSCGRSRAVEAIVQTLRASSGSSDQVSIGVIGFGGGATVIVPETPLAGFNIDGSALCRSDLGWTNYKATFETATTTLQGSARKNKLLYFISDGMPTRGGSVIMTNPSTHFTAGSQAAATMRNGIQGLNFNALLLQSQANGWIGIDPRQYLTELTGDASRVRIVSEANALATQAVELLAGPVAINPGSVSARLVDANGASSNVQVLSFDPGASSLPGSNQGASSWSFKTGSFAIPASRAGSYQLLIEGTDSSGAKKSSTVSIRVQ